MADKVYVLKKPAQVNVVGGMSTLMLAGAVLPENTDPKQLQHLLDNDYAVEGDFVGGLEPVFTGDMTEQLTGPVADDLTGGAPESEDDGDQAPAKSASRADWDEYAKKQGLTDEEVADFSSKEDLQKHFGVE